jgi:hypothetical protein
MAFDLIQSLEDVRPGDIMLSSMGNTHPRFMPFMPGFFPVRVGQYACGQTFRMGRFTVDHVGIVVEESKRLPPGSTYRGQLYETGVITAPRLVQAMPHGAEEIEMRVNTHWTNKHVYIRLPQNYTGQGEDAAAIARLFVEQKVRYSFPSYAAIAAWSRGWKTPKLEAWINRRHPEAWLELPFSMQRIALPLEAICSVLVDQCLTMTGMEVLKGLKPQAVSPGMLANQLWNRVGVIRGGKGIVF